MKLFLLALSLIFLSSCAIPMSGRDFEDEARRVSATKSFKVGSKSQVLYKGTDETHHYFYISPTFGIPRSIKVKKQELQLNEEFPYSDDSDKWLDFDSVY